MEKRGRDSVVEKLFQIPISVQCWQGDDIGGYEKRTGASGGGILTTGNYPGKARTADELRQDVDQLRTLVSGKFRFALHAIYLESEQPVDRREIRPEHFARWTAWAKDRGIGLDFNPTFFAHPMAADGFTLSSPDAEVRKFWIDHAKACRTICDSFGREFGTPCVMNTWIPDGFKDIPVDRRGARARLKDSLDQIFAIEYSKSEIRMFRMQAELRFILRFRRYSSIPANRIFTLLWRIAGFRKRWMNHMNTRKCCSTPGSIRNTRRIIRNWKAA